MKLEMKLEMDINMTVCLGEYLKHLASFKSPIEGLELEYFVAIEFYEKKFKQFNLLKERKMTIKASQAIALTRMLKAIETDDGITIVFVNDLISKLHKEFPIT